jgi:hypothetical protein
VGYLCPEPYFALKNVFPPDEGIVGATVLRPTLMIPPRSENPPIVPGSPDSLPTLEALLGLSNRAVTPSCYGTVGVVASNSIENSIDVQPSYVA